MTPDDSTRRLSEAELAALRSGRHAVLARFVGLVTPLMREVDAHLNELDDVPPADLKYLKSLVCPECRRTNTRIYASPYSRDRTYQTCYHECLNVACKGKKPWTSIRHIEIPASTGVTTDE